MKIASWIGLAALCASTLSGWAASETHPGREAAEFTFETIDSQSRGFIHAGDMEIFRANVFAGMDYDGDNKVTYTEFAAWDPGFKQVAEAEGRPEAFATATKIVFSFWDRNGNGELTEAEMRFAMSSDFRRADIDDDGILTQTEFIDGFGVIVALRAAIRPDL